MDIEHKQLVQLLPLLPLLAELGRTEHVTETAELLGVPQSTVSRALASVDVFVEVSPRWFALTPLADRLRELRRRLGGGSDDGRSPEVGTETGTGSRGPS